MLIYLDNIIFSLQKTGGISVYWYELARRLQNQVEAYFIDSHSSENNLFARQLQYSENRRCRDIPLPMVLNRYIPVTVRLNTRSLFHSSYYRVATQPGVANIVTVHDFTYEFYRSGLPRFVHRLQKWFALLLADGIICDSENTRKDMLNLYPGLRKKRQAVIYLGANSAFRPLCMETGTSAPFVEPEQRPYVIFIGDRRPAYKNFKLAVEAVGLLETYRLAIVGSHPLSADEEKHIHRHLGDRYNLYYSPNSEALNRLYNRAFCLLYPSMYEGFGLPVLEALSSGCPVVTTNRSSIPEVIGTSGMVMDKVTPRTLADAIKQFENPAIREKFILSGLKQASQFSWQRCVRETLNFYQFVYDDVFNR